jgi:mycoredoxin
MSTPSIIMYSTSWCADCRNAKRFLQAEGIPYTEIDIDEHEEAAQLVIAWSGGRRVIPTFCIMRDDAKEAVILHNPDLSILAAALRSSAD